MSKTGRKVSIVMVDDDEDDCFIIRDALSESDLDHTLKLIGSGLELIDYLRGCGKYEGLDTVCPDLVLLDLHMPDLDGKEVLREIKKDPRLSHMDVVVLTGSTDRSELLECYQLGATAVFVKSKWLDTFAEIIRISSAYWFKFVTFQLGPVLHESDSRPGVWEL
ncbi:MAG: response regulator [Syntrophobacteraceae bacterium]